MSSDEYQRFFEHITGTKTPYKYLLHYSSDVPLSIKAMLYIPNTHTERMGIGQEPCQISLYSRKILIKQNMEQLLPKYLRFVKGVVDCEDLPLNLSRETYQGSAHIEKLKTTIAKRVIKMLEDEMKKDPAGYTLWYRDFQQFIKEGLAMDQDNGEALLRLVRFPSSLSESTITLDDYLNKLGKDENKIYYFFAPKRDMAMGSPYLEPFKSTGVPVLFTEYHLDEMCLRNIGKYKDHEFTNIESSYEDILADFEKRYPEKMRGKKVEPMPEQDVTPFCLWIKNELGANVQQVTASRRYSEAPGLIVGQVSSSMRQIMAMFDPEVSVLLHPRP